MTSKHQSYSKVGTQIRHEDWLDVVNKWFTQMLSMLCALVNISKACQINFVENFPRNFIHW